MKILVDADGCPVINITVELCNQYHMECLLLCDTAHNFQRNGAHTLTFDKGSDSVDFALVSRIEDGDIVITQDYGLASMCLARKARVLHQDGWEYTVDNIDAHLLFRHNSRKLRASGVRLKGPKKRTVHQDHRFREALNDLLQTSVQG